MRKHWPLFAILAVYLALAIGLVARVPLNAAPDEAAHWTYISAIATTHCLPVFHGEVPPAPGYEFHQPPLYYALCAPAWALTGPGVQNYLCRAINVLLGGATVAVIWFSVQLLLPGRRDLAILAAGLAALWPVHLNVAIASGNDTLAGLFSATLFYLMARGSLRGWRSADLVLAGLVMALGLWTKTTTVVLWAAALGCVLEATRRRSALRPALTCLGVAMLLGLPLFARNQFLYGDPLGLKEFQRAATAGTPGFPQFSQAGIPLSDYFRGIFVVTLVNAWGVFGGPDSAAKAVGPLSANGPHIPGLFPPFLVLSLTLAAVLAALGVMRELSTEHQVPKERHSLLRTVSRWWTVGLVLIVLAWLQFSYNHFSGAQVRYLHAALLPVCVGFAVGWTRLWGRGAVRVAATLVVAALLLSSVIVNILIWRTVV